MAQRQFWAVLEAVGDISGKSETPNGPANKTSLPRAVSLCTVKCSILTYTLRIGRKICAGALEAPLSIPSHQNDNRRLVVDCFPPFLVHVLLLFAIVFP